MRVRFCLVVVAGILGGLLPVAPAAARAPSNDDISGAIPFLDFPQWLEFTTEEATATEEDALHTCDGVASGHTTWYALSSDEATTMFADAWWTDWGVTLSLFTGEPGALTQIDCSYGDWGAYLQWDADPATTYYLRVGSLGSDPGGWVGLDLYSYVPAEPFEMTFELADTGAFVLRGGQAQLTGTLTCSRAGEVELYVNAYQERTVSDVEGFAWDFVWCDETPQTLTIDVFPYEQRRRFLYGDVMIGGEVWGCDYDWMACDFVILDETVTLDQVSVA